jgi:hypothetical protein
MQRVQQAAESREQPPAFAAVGEVALDPPAPTWSELAVEILRHAAWSPAVVAPEARAFKQLAHSRFDPIRGRNGSRVCHHRGLDAGRRVGFSAAPMLGLSTTSSIPASRVLAQIKADGSSLGVLHSLLASKDFLDLIGMPEIRELEHRFADGEGGG